MFAIDKLALLALPIHKTQHPFSITDTCSCSGTPVSGRVALIMSFTIRFKPQERFQVHSDQTAQLLHTDLLTDHPDFRKHNRYLSLLCHQSNQISGINSEFGEQDVASNGPTGLRHCWQCNNLSTDHVEEGKHPVVRGMLSKFEAAAHLGCEICRLLLTAISPYRGPGRLKAYIRPGAALNIFVKCADKNARFDLFTPIGWPISLWTGIGQARPVPKIFKGPEVVNILRGWLDDCKMHKICGSAEQLGPPPTRIIKVAFDELRLVEFRSLQKPYIALSHCWGTGSLPKTTKATYEQHRHGIQWESLTKTFQDAMIIVLALGLEYIWIDSLCIIQDDDEDWRAEASRMSSIYENAELVLSATGAKDGSEGLFRDRQPIQVLASEDSEETSTVRECESVYQTIPLHGPGECDDSNCPVYVSRDTARHAQWDPEPLIAQHSNDFNPLLSRAWAFQERLLATRIVHFADHELIWECKETQRCECMHLDRSDGRPRFERDPDLKILFSRATARSIHDRLPLDLYTLWAKIVEKYTERALTFEKDRLLALQGAIQVMQRCGLGQCAGGVFLDDMPSCLLWYVAEPGRRSKENSAPTWSWASVVPQPKQAPRVLYPWYHFAEDLRAIQHFPDGPMIRLVQGPFELHHNSGGTARLGLHVTGPLVPATLNIAASTESFLDLSSSRSLFDAPFRKYTYSVSRNGQRVSFHLDIDIQLSDETTEHSFEVSLAAMAKRQDRTWPDQILVLKRVDSEDAISELGISSQDLDPMFSRIGLITRLRDMTVQSDENEDKDWFSDAEQVSMILV